VYLSLLAFKYEVPESSYVWYQQVQIIMQNVAIRNVARFKLVKAAGIHVAIVGQDAIDSYHSIPWRNPHANQMDHVFARYELEDHAT
jgi:hypothetical protein